MIINVFFIEQSECFVAKVSWSIHNHLIIKKNESNRVYLPPTGCQIVTSQVHFSVIQSEIEVSR